MYDGRSLSGTIIGKVMGKEQKLITHTSCMVIQPFKFKMLLFLLYGFLTSRFQILPILPMEVFSIENPI